MGLPGITDNDDVMVRLLKQIAENTGGSSSGPRTEVTIEGESAPSRVGAIDPASYVIVETDDLDGVDNGSMVTAEPGDSVVLAEFTPDTPFSVLAVGAVDEQGVQYELRADYQRTIGGRTNSPLGLINSPFSFAEATGGVVVCEQAVQYVAHYDKEATGPVDLAARLHVEVVG